MMLRGPPQGWARNRVVWQPPARGGGEVRTGRSLTGGRNGQVRTGRSEGAGGRCVGEMGRDCGPRPKGSQNTAFFAAFCSVLWYNLGKIRQRIRNGGPCGRPPGCGSSGPVRVKTRDPLARHKLFLGNSLRRLLPRRPAVCVSCPPPRSKTTSQTLVRQQVGRRAVFRSEQERPH